MTKKAALLFSASFFILSSAAPALAQSGLAYTARSPLLREDDGDLHSLTYARPDGAPVDAPNVTAQSADKKKEETPSDKAWEKYKALATGQVASAESAAKIPTPTPPTAPNAPSAAPAQEEPAPVGLAGILQEYQKTKAARSEMKTLVVTPPEEAKKIEEETEKKRMELALPGGEQSAPEPAAQTP